ncbi:MAG: hypothetical protein LBD59_02540 [Prevotellaceae bacterium]|nr:hypothetical protein [Prevotellaceae bacterium]
MSVRKVGYTQTPSRQGRNVGRKHEPNHANTVPSGTECKNHRGYSLNN